MLGFMIFGNALAFFNKALKFTKKENRKQKLEREREAYPRPTYLVAQNDPAQLADASHLPPLARRTRGAWPPRAGTRRGHLLPLCLSPRRPEIATQPRPLFHSLWRFSSPLVLSLSQPPNTIAAALAATAASATASPF